MDRKIGVIDSGIGGLTVAKSMQKLLPGEDIIYFGDNINVPYGNKTREDILRLTLNILNFMKQNNVKIVAVACNTISTLINEYKKSFDFPIIDIISPVVDHIIKMDTYNLSIIATEFTIHSKAYQNLLLEKNPDISITTEASRTLATLIDKGEFDSVETRQVVAHHINNLLAKGDVYNLVLACTHFPIVGNLFSDIAPQIKLIDPGFEQAKAIKTYLISNNLFKVGEKGSLDIYTSGETSIYEKTIQHLGLKNIMGITRL